MIRLVLICACAWSACAREEVRRDFRKTVPLAAGRSVRLDNSLGSVTVRAQGRGDVAIQATIRCSAASAAEARAWCDRIQILVEESGGVSVRTQYPDHNNTRNLSWGVDYDVTIPETAPLDLRNRFGSVTVTGLHAPGIINSGNGRVYFSGGRGRQQIDNTFGDVEVRTNDGELVVRNANGAVLATDITGPVDITDRFGKVRVSNAGRNVTIHSNNGDIEIAGAGGVATVTNTFGPVAISDARGNVSVVNQNGEVRANGVDGAAELHTTFGKVSFTRIGKALTVQAQNTNVTGDTVGDSATIGTTFGSVDVRGVKAGARVTAGNSPVRLNGIGGEVYAQTTFAEVRVTDVAGPVTVENQNGSVTVETRSGQRCQPISAHTSFSPIRVTIPGSAGYNVTARTSFGRIHSDADLTVAGDIGANELKGKIGAGGCELRLLNQNGNIDILK